MRFPDGPVAGYRIVAPLDTRGNLRSETGSTKALCLEHIPRYLPVSSGAGSLLRSRRIWRPNLGLTRFSSLSCLGSIGPLQGRPSRSSGTIPCVCWETRLVAAQLLRQSGQPETAGRLRDGKAEWSLFHRVVRRALTIYRHRQDLQEGSPISLAVHHEALCDWLTARRTSGTRLSGGHREAILNDTVRRVVGKDHSFLARREDVANHFETHLLSDNPDAVLRNLTRAVGDGLEVDLDDVVVFQHIHKMSRHLLVPLYLELPPCAGKAASRVAGNNIESSPESVRHMEWAIPWR